MRHGWSRREVAIGGGLLALALGLPAGAAPPRLPQGEAPSPRLALLLKTVSQIVIPRTGTAGAGELGVGAFLTLALAHGLEGTREALAHAAADWPLRKDGSLRYDLWLEQELRRSTGADFLALPAAQQAQILRDLDAQAFPAGPPPTIPSPWVRIKGLILTGYYTSETGASRELRYNLIPGRWDGDIPLATGAHAYSSDWTAVEFG
jgi:hypothetical protein